jgi:hypothetical protein
VGEEWGLAQEGGVVGVLSGAEGVKLRKEGRQLRLDSLWERAALSEHFKA